VAEPSPFCGDYAPHHPSVNPSRSVRSSHSLWSLQFHLLAPLFHCSYIFLLSTYGVLSLNKGSRGIFHCFIYGILSILLLRQKPPHLQTPFLCTNKASLHLVSSPRVRTDNRKSKESIANAALLSLIPVSVPRRYAPFSMFSLACCRCTLLRWAK
jgi:hypothetical protein